MFLLGLAIGFYLGGLTVTNVVAGEPVSSRPPTLTERLCMPLVWPFRLLMAEDPKR